MYKRFKFGIKSFFDLYSLAKIFVCVFDTKIIKIVKQFDKRYRIFFKVVTQKIRR